jgi:RNA polymerase sigma-70 factor (ECF subfamily)
MPELANSYLAVVPQVAPRSAAFSETDLEAILTRLYTLGRAGHPDVELDRARFGAHLARCKASLDEDLDAGRAADLYLACAALGADPRAIIVLQCECWPVALRYLRSFEALKGTIEDLRQDLWDALLVGKPATEPKLRAYSGRGPIAHFAGIAAQRLALMRIRSDDARARVADRAAREMNVLAGDAELTFLKSRYRDAFRDALCAALALLDDRSRLILRLYLVDGLSFDRIARLYNVSQPTISRWMAKIRISVVTATRARLGECLRIPDSEFESLWNLVASQLDISIAGVLG